MLRVPLAISWPGVIEEGRRSGALVELDDIAPTLLDAVGIGHPPGMQARSLWPMLVGEADLGSFREDVYCECYNAHMSHHGVFATMVRTERHKLVAVHGDDMGELYDLEEDPSETVNRWDDADYAPVKLDMLKRLADRMAQTPVMIPRVCLFFSYVLDRFRGGFR